MKRINSVLLVLLVLLLLVAAVFWFGGKLQVSGTAATANAVDYPETTLSVRNILVSGAAPQLFATELPGTADGLTLIDMTIRLGNIGLFPAEWVDMTVHPVSGDLAVYSMTGEGGTVPARSVGTANLKMISSAPADTQRVVEIHYYTFGMKRTVQVLV